MTEEFTFIPHQADDELVWEFVMNQFPTTKEPFREAIANALDEGSKQVNLVVTSKRLEVEDWGRGIPDPYKFARYGSREKLRRTEKTIGRKGLGKLSLLRLAKTTGIVNFKTANELGSGWDIYMEVKGHRVKPGKLTDFLEHQGTKVIIDDPVDLPDMEDLVNFLRRTFGLRILKGVKIILNGTELQPKVGLNFNPQEHLIARLPSKIAGIELGNVDIKGNLYADPKGKGAVDLYIDNVYVATEIVDVRREFSGWVNCNELSPGTNRNEVVHDVVYKELMLKLQQHAARFPTRMEEEVSNAEVRLANQWVRYMKEYMRDFGLLSKSNVPLIALRNGQTVEAQNSLQPPHAQPQVEGTNPEVQHPDAYKNKVHTSIEPDGETVKRRIKTDYNIQVLLKDFGPDKDPIFYLYPTDIIMNKGNELYKRAMKSKDKELLLMTYWARTAVSMNPEAHKWSRDEYNKEFDKAYMFFVKMRENVGA